MNTKFASPLLVACFLLAPAHADTVEMGAGPKVRLTYDATVWKPLAPFRAPEAGHFQAQTWVFQKEDWAQVTVASHPDRKTEPEFKRETLDMQKFRGDPAVLVRERRDNLAGQNCLVLEFRNPHTSPPRSEVHYFLSTNDGHARLSVIVEEASMPKLQEAIQSFLGKIHFQ